VSAPGRLHAWRGEALRLADVLEVFAAETRDEPTRVALLMQPAACLLARLEPDGWRDAGGAPVAFDAVFEARGFCPRGALRFVHDAAGRGRAVYLSEHPPGAALRAQLPTEVSRDYEAYLDGTYLLWGQATAAGPRDGWSRLFTARIGPLDVPVGLRRGSGCQIVTREYVSSDGYGNACVIEERLVELREATS